MIRKPVIVTILALSLGLILAACGGAGGDSGENGGGEEHTMKIAHAAAPESARDQGAQTVKEVVEGEDSCSMTVEIYPSGQLGGTTDLIEGMQQGSIESVILPAAFLGGFQPLMGVMDLPFFWPTDPDELIEVHESEATEQLLATTDEIGVNSLAVWHTGYKQWTANRPLETPEDFQGLDVRAMPSPVLVEQAEVLGANPISIDFAETYGALQTGALNGQENPIDTIYDMGFQEVQEYMTMTNHGTLDQIFMVSQQWQEGLPEECRQVIEEAVEQGGDVTYEQTYEVIDEATAAFEEAGMQTVELTPEQEQAHAEATEPVMDFYLSETDERGEELVREFEEEIQ